MLLYTQDRYVQLIGHQVIPSAHKDQHMVLDFSI